MARVLGERISAASSGTTGRLRSVKARSWCDQGVWLQHREVVERDIEWCGQHG